MNNSRRIARHFCGQRYELLTKRQSEHRQGTTRTTPPTNPASPPSRMGCARTGKLHCPVAWTTHRTPHLADSFTAAPHAYNRPNPKGAEPLLGTTPAPYLRRTNVVTGAGVFWVLGAQSPKEWRPRGPWERAFLLCLCHPNSKISRGTVTTMVRRRSREGLANGRGSGGSKWVQKSLQPTDCEQ